MKRLILPILIVLLSAATTEATYAQSCCAKSKKADTDSKTTIAKMMSNDYVLTDHNGKSRTLKELIKDKVVVMNFIFTSCKTICPPMGANFAALKKELGDRAKQNLIMLSVSIDPTTDTPERLKAWKNNFEDDDDELWTLLTGKKTVIDQLLKDLSVFTPLIEEHAPIIIMGSDYNEEWIRTNGLAQPAVLAHKVDTYLQEATSAFNEKANIGYFTDLELINQHGEKFRFYSDLMKDKVVIINPFFSECMGTCPMMHSKLKEVQAFLGEKLGESVNILSISIDPVRDTPKILSEYAAGFDTRKGWHFLSGKVSNVNTITKKLGKYVDNREQHDTIFLIGNLNTGLWEKVNGLAKTEEIIAELNEVMQDQNDSE